jgi:hypothetical protein
LKYLLAILVIPIYLQRSRAEQAPNSTGTQRSIIVTVIDSHGNPIRDLSRENFAALIDGKRAPVIDARYTNTQRRIVVLLDVSLSMTGKENGGKWPIVRDAIQDLISQTPTDVPIAVVTFASETREVFGFQESRSAIVEWLDQKRKSPKQKGARTALFDAIIDGLNLLDVAQPGDVLYAITDGDENASRNPAQRARVSLLRSHVRLFALFFGGHTPLLFQESEDTFKGLVRDSGGLTFSIDGHQRSGAPWDLEYAYDTQNRDMVKSYTTELNLQASGFWVLEVGTPSSRRKSSLKLAIIDRTGNRRNDIGLAYPRVLLSPR